MVWLARGTGYTLSIDRHSDNDLISAIKQILKEMIKSNPSDRPSIAKVAEQFAKLLEVSAEGVLVAATNQSWWARAWSEWKELPEMPPECANVFRMCICGVPDGIVVAGGANQDEATSQCYHFSLLTGVWRVLPDMPSAKASASAVVLGDALMVIGGCNKYGLSSTCEKLNMREGVWSTAAPVLCTMKQPLVAVAAGKIYVIPRKDIQMDIDMQEYDSTTNRFVWAAHLPRYVQNTEYACLVSAADKLYLLGGLQRLAEQYSPAANQWTPLRAKPTITYDMGCSAVVHGGKLLLCGGNRHAMNKNSVEEFNIQTQQWRLTDCKLPFCFLQTESFLASITM